MRILVRDIYGYRLMYIQRTQKMFKTRGILSYVEEKINKNTLMESLDYSKLLILSHTNCSFILSSIYHKCHPHQPTHAKTTTTKKVLRML